MAKSTTEKEVLFTIDGFEVKSNSVYLVTDKPDGDAPTGFVDAGVSKLPSDGVDESFQFPWVATSPTTGVWDTGFHKFSPCLKDMTEKEQEVYVKTLMDNLVKPYRQATGSARVFDPEHPDLIKAIRTEVHSGKLYHTADPVERMHLYMAIRAHQAAPKGKEGSSAYRQAFYLIVDTEKDKKTKNEGDLMFFDAISLFNTLFENNPKLLVAILRWMDFKVADGVDKGTLVSIFKDNITSIGGRAKLFIDNVAEAQNDVTTDKFFVYKKILELQKKSTKITKAPSGLLYYEDVEIGADFKVAAENIAKNKSLLEIKNAILLD